MQAFLLFSHQLFSEVTKQPKHTVMFLIEDARSFRPDSNPARAVFERAALQAVRERLLVKGFPVEYLAAEEYPTLEAALEAVARGIPEVTRFFDVGDKTLERLLATELKRHQLPVQVLPTPAPRLSLSSKERFVPEVFEPIEPNRYVLEAAHYVGRRITKAQEFEFAYPVTPGDAEEWTETIADQIRGGADPKALIRDLAPLLSAGLITLPKLEEHLGDDTSEQGFLEFRQLLTN